MTARWLGPWVLAVAFVALGAVPAAAGASDGRGFTFGVDAGAMGQHEVSGHTRVTFAPDTVGGGVVLLLDDAQRARVTRGGIAWRMEMGYGLPRAWRIQYAVQFEADPTHVWGSDVEADAAWLVSHLLDVHLYPRNGGNVPWYLVTGLGAGTRPHSSSGVAAEFGAGIELQGAWRLSLIGQRTRLGTDVVWSMRLQAGLHR